MFKRGFNKFLDKQIDKPEIYPYVYSIGLKGLTSHAKKEIKTHPIQCSQCGAILTDVTLIKDDPKIGTHYKCEYCGTINIINKTQIIESLPNDIDFLIEDVEPKESKEEIITKVAATEGELYIAVIDISGSMSGAKIEAVKKSLIQTVKDFKVNSPLTKFILIAFESSVYYYLRHDIEPINFSGDLLFSLENMKEKLNTSLKKGQQDTLGSIGEFADGWIRNIEGLRSMDMTALGPALYFGVISFDTFQMQGSGRITLLTDGIANQGIGNLSGTSVSTEKFYEEMANICNNYKIIVDVVGVSVPGDNNEMGLKILGTLSDKTGGKLYFISHDEMESIFSELRQTNFIGKDVKIKIIAPTNINIKNVTGAFSSSNVKESEINLGAVTEDRELFVELDSSKGFKGIKNEEVPVQLQVEYKDKDGRKRLRVVNDRVKITKDEKEFKAEYDQKYNVMMNIQSSGQQWYSGNAEQSRRHLQELKQNIIKEKEDLKAANVKFSEQEFDDGLTYLDDELEEMNAEEEKSKSAPKASYMAAGGQTRSRFSQDKVEERLKKKGKK